MNTETHVRGISGSTLKLIAVFTMLIDHTGATVIRTICSHPSISSNPELHLLWNQIYTASRSIGRIAFPIFCFLLVEGFLHTRSVRRYAERLFLFALISEIPFDLALKGSWYFPAKQNVYFTLLIGLLVLIGLRQLSGKAAKAAAHETPANRTFCSLGITALRLLAVPLLLAAGMYLAYFIDTDYNFKGVFLIGVLYLTGNSRLLACAGGAASVAWEMPAPIAFIPVWLYNGTRGLRMKYFFYWFYPVHLVLLHLLSKYLIPTVL